MRQNSWALWMVSSQLVANWIYNNIILSVHRQQPPSLLFLLLLFPGLLVFDHLFDPSPLCHYILRTAHQDIPSPKCRCGQYNENNPYETNYTRHRDVDYIKRPNAKYIGKQRQWVNPSHFMMIRISVIHTWKLGLTKLTIRESERPSAQHVTPVVVHFERVRKDGDNE